MRIIVGLGNPGKEYAYTRHNIGFLLLDHLAEKWNIKIDKIKFKSLCGEGFYQGEKVLLIKPQTFMNLSGEAVLDATQFYKVPTEDILVIYDDMDIEPGRLRLRLNGSSGGHKGMESIIYLLKSQDFPRLRIGIGKPAPQMATVGHVLGKFTETEEKVFSEAVKRGAEAVEMALDEGVEKAMNKVNIVR